MQLNVERMRVLQSKLYQAIWLKRRFNNKKNKTELETSTKFVLHIIGKSIEQSQHAESSKISFLFFC